MFIDQPMSKRAQISIANGEMPLSYWTRPILKEKAYEAWGICVNRFPLHVLRACLLYKTDPHHFGPRYLKTDFYAFDNTHDKETILIILEHQYNSVSSDIELKNKTEWTYGYITFTAKDSHGNINKHVEFGKSNGIQFISNEGKVRKILWKKLYSFTPVEIKDELREEDIETLLNPSFTYSKYYCS